MKSKLKKSKIVRSQRMEIKFPTQAAQNYIDQCLGYNRFLWNRYVSNIKFEQDICKSLNLKLSYSEYYDILKDIQYYYNNHDNRNSFEEEMPSCIRNTTHNRINSSINAFVRNRQNIDIRFKCWYDNEQSFTFDFTKCKKMNYFTTFNNKPVFRIQYGYKCSLNKNDRYIIMSEPIRFEGEVKTVTIQRINKKYYAIFQIELTNNSHLYNYTQEELNNRKEKAAFDLGVKDLMYGYYDCDDKFYDTRLNYDKETLKTLDHRIKMYQRSLSNKYNKNNHKSNQSKSYCDLLEKLRKTYKKCTNIKTNFIHKYTTDICKNFKQVNIEDLDIKYLTSKKKNKKSNSTLRRNILKQKWGFIISCLEYKSIKFNTKLVKVNKYFPSTQTCSSCHTRKIKKDKLKLSDRTYICNHCGLELNRDLNAAINLYNYI
jgi:IS605 OrfB family transposase